MKKINLAIILFSQLFLSLLVCAQDTAELEEAAAPADVSATIATYLSQIEAAEKQYGPYANQVGEPLFALGKLYQEHDMNDEAFNALQRSLHIKKVNDGIESLTQVPILTSLIVLSGESQKWQELDTHLLGLLHVYRQNYEPGDAALLNITNEVGQWKISAYRNELLKRRRAATDLEDAVDIFQSHLESLTEAYGENDPRAVPLLNGMAMARYYLYSEATDISLQEYEGIGNKTIKVKTCRYVRDPEGRLIEICTENDVPNNDYYATQQMAKDSELKNRMDFVKSLLEKVIQVYEVHPELPAAEKALALVNLGDWHFMNDKAFKAIEVYKQAYELLEQNPSEDINVETVFGQPQSLPALIMPVAATASRPLPPGQPFVKMSLDVDVKGKPKRVKVVEESEPENRLARKKIRDHLRSSLFRPRFENGEPVTTKKAVLYFSTAGF